MKNKDIPNQIVLCEEFLNQKVKYFFTTKEKSIFLTNIEKNNDPVPEGIPVILRLSSSNSTAISKTVSLRLTEEEIGKAIWKIFLSIQSKASIRLKTNPVDLRIADVKLEKEEDGRVSIQQTIVSKHTYMNFPQNPLTVQNIHANLSSQVTQPLVFISNNKTSICLNGSQVKKINWGFLNIEKAFEKELNLNKQGFDQLIKRYKKNSLSKSMQLLTKKILISSQTELLEKLNNFFEKKEEKNVIYYSRKYQELITFGNKLKSKVRYQEFIQEKALKKFSFTLQLTKELEDNIPLDTRLAILSYLEYQTNSKINKIVQRQLRWLNNK
ncbi:MAG: hypothetical protein COU06_02465 [Candidatus Harrisonbacteria bacterium CG10_big_fil_rev_8_21_14_0_10_38_8]|uniref:Uncharacterized protein n=1 Tax=Candidatus Harrisonbacteria bacterium CG10_big_fil_rev_8_21_14_0_10_38_8 TaxID=1974582 RepID=A0A2M6WJI3_9BACT|nr:MAG: hypothetical protein COU06_02465 [Candidatus Harrisonbacteria bacterium CG10_big_fil_rev_8_21_14_0_10_38_8]